MDNALSGWSCISDSASVSRSFTSWFAQEEARATESNVIRIGFIRSVVPMILFVDSNIIIISHNWFPRAILLSRKSETSPILLVVKIL